MPYEALRGMKTLNLIVLPDKLTKIGIAAFADDQNLTGSLIIPEGVTEIEVGAFANCHAMNGSISFPSTLKYIGRKEDRWWYGGTFARCGFNSKLILPSNLECLKTRWRN